MKVTYTRTVLLRPPCTWRKLGQQIVLENPSRAMDRGMQTLGFQRALPADQAMSPSASLQRELPLAADGPIPPETLS